MQEISSDISGNETVVAIYGTDGRRYTSLSELPSGIYIVRFSNNRTAKILKK
ncbi:MAG: T9SS type A sorting domain-containing protein [Muribaculaceae bacterium]|nr:T9SS type A sorting domain-containing protein [Muribaculaceae bacterium]